MLVKIIDVCFYEILINELGQVLVRLLDLRQCVYEVLAQHFTKLIFQDDILFGFVGKNEPVTVNLILFRKGQ